MVEFLAATVVVAATAGCGSSAPSPATTIPAADESSILAPVHRATEVADQVNQREADLELMVAEMGG